MTLTLRTLALLHAMASVASAADIPPAAREACMGDARTHCKGVMPGGGRIVACFVKNAGALSGGCKTELSKMSCASDAPGELKSAFPCKE